MDAKTLERRDRLAAAALGGLVSYMGTFPSEVMEEVLGGKCVGRRLTLSDYYRSYAVMACGYADAVLALDPPADKDTLPSPVDALVVRPSGDKCYLMKFEGRPAYFSIQRDDGGSYKAGLLAKRYFHSTISWWELIVENSGMSSCSSAYRWCCDQFDELCMGILDIRNKS